jgi:AcrR family transcriptional regulator
MNRQSLAGADDGPRSKRAAILAAAITQFGEVGYEATKWSEVAQSVGIGQTALYHYFESKAHCLLTIMRLGLWQAEEQFHAAVEPAKTPTEALQAAVRAAYELSDSDALQSRILQANIALLGAPRQSAREEAERVACLELVARVEGNWAALLERGMAAGEFPRRDPLILARAVLGLIVSVYRWYRPGGPVPLPQLAEFIEGCCTRMVRDE